MPRLETEAELERRREREELQRTQRRSDLRAVMSTPEGRRFVARLIYEHGALNELGFHTDARQHAFNDGQRSVGWHLEAEVRREARDAWALMEHERITDAALELPDEEPHKTDT